MKVVPRATAVNGAASLGRAAVARPAEQDGPSSRFAERASAALGPPKGAAGAVS